MHSTLKCNKTYYFQARDGNIQVVESDSLIVASLKQDLIGERAVSKGLNFQVILDKVVMSAGFILASMENCAKSNNSFL